MVLPPLSVAVSVGVPALRRVRERQHGPRCVSPGRIVHPERNVHHTHDTRTFTHSLAPTNTQTQNTNTCAYTNAPRHMAAHRNQARTNDDTAAGATPAWTTRQALESPVGRRTHGREDARCCVVKREREGEKE